MIAGHYRLVEHIGSGAMGIVWRAIDERLERSVAVKQIIAQPGLSEAERDTMRQRAMREARNAARFQHPNAIVVFDIAEHEGDPCLVMEYLPSRSLAAILTEYETLPVPEVARIGEQVASALIAAHRAGIVHRDIKPGNILIDDNGVCKITDFGISRASGDLTLTQTGLIGGTPAYLAPELARGADPKPSSDVFALGATLYHAIEGVPPYGDNTNQLALLYAAASGKINPPRQAGPATALLMRLLSPEPEDRPSMTEARDKLAALASGQSAVAAAVAPPAPKEQTRELDAMPPAPVNPPNPPPWRRDAAPEPAPQAPQPAASSSASANASSGGGRRKNLIFGAVAAVVLIVATGLVIILTNSGDDGDAHAGPSSSQRPSTTPTSTPASAPPSSEAELSNYQSAGELLVEYYYGDGGGPKEAWDLLTPHSQQTYFGSKADYDAYWSQHKIVHVQKAIVDQSNPKNPDGSLNMSVEVDFGNGHQRMYLRVLQLDGKLKLDGDPRPESNQRQQ
ncbi:Serine/threonine protein kinase [Saccharomonospora viridis]|uniref:non-specific serine/threonine protein kinase n=2 Tax=Saccharomonospora viridis TaxID=1852 RepID=A0A837D7L3_9PSEU|nr:serine/threonine-protein kinase [Saccharomonospora viridis]KHF43773.1 serine/threonine protein kinase [Saccharomonospora viridis]SFP84177.1 Serine/threonine protein kinase [Saccharomonospora viridis]